MRQVLGLPRFSLAYLYKKYRAGLPTQTGQGGGGASGPLRLAIPTHFPLKLCEI